MDPARTANNPLSGLSASNVSTLRQLWSTSGNPGVALVANGVVLPASTLGGVFTTRALNVSDGSVRWTSDVVFGAVDGNVAYGVGPNGLTAASIGNGQLLWSATTSGFSVVGATDGKVLVRGAEAPRGYYFPEIQVWDASTHRELWTFYDTDDHTPPAVANGVGYFVQVPAPPTPADPSLHAVDLADGHERWSISLRPGCQITGPVVSHGYVFWAGATYKASDGTFVANWPFCPTFGSDFATGGTTVFAERPGTTAGSADFVSFDGVTGAVHWSNGVSTGTPQFSVTNPEPVIGNDVVFASVNGGTVGFDTASGKPVALLGGVTAESAVDGTLFAGGSAVLSAFRPR